GGAAGAGDDEGRGATDYRPRGAPVKKRRSISGFLAQTVQGPGVVGQDRSSGGRRRALVQTIALDEPAERFAQRRPRPLGGQREQLGQAADVRSVHELAERELGRASCRERGG